MWPFTRRKTGDKRPQLMSQEELLMLSIQEKLKSYNRDEQHRARFSGPAPLYGNDVLGPNRVELELLDFDQAVN